MSESRNRDTVGHLPEVVRILATSGVLLDAVFGGHDDLAPASPKPS
mgnify:CR=1 FL=1